MWYTPETCQIEKNLVHWCKTGEPVAIPGTRQKGLEQYRRLIRNNIHNAMEQAFPIARTVLTETQWARLIDDFLAQHPAATPQVWQLPREFYTFVKKGRYAGPFSLPFLNNLLLFEWTEIEVHTMKDKKPAPYTMQGNPLSDRLVVHPEHKLIKLAWPVHLYAAREALKHPGHYFLLTFRTRDFDVKFVDLPALHAHFFERIVAGETGKTILQKIIRATPRLVNSKALQNNFTAFVQTMRTHHIFCGYQKPRTV